MRPMTVCSHATVNCPPSRESRLPSVHRKRNFYSKVIVYRLSRIFNLASTRSAMIVIYDDLLYGFTHMTTFFTSIVSVYICHIRSLIGHRIIRSPVVVIRVPCELGPPQPWRLGMTVTAVQAVFVKGGNLREVLGVQRERKDLIFVGPDALRRHGLGDDCCRALQTPCQQHHVGRRLVLCSDGTYHRVFSEGRALVKLLHRIGCAAHAGVGSHDDPVRLAVLKELRSLVERMRLELVHGNRLAPFSGCQFRSWTRRCSSPILRLRALPWQAMCLQWAHCPSDRR